MHYYTSANVQNGSVNYPNKQVNYNISGTNFAYSNDIEGTTSNYPEYFPEYFPVELRFKLILKNPRQNFSIKRAREL